MRASFFRHFTFAALILGLVLSVGCERKTRPQQVARVAENQINKIRFQQIFISFNEVDPNIKRTKAEAKVLAEKIYSDLKKRPSDFPDFVRQYSDDKFPAVYTLANYGQPLTEGDRERDDFPPAVGLKVFELKLGEVALVPYDKISCPAGFHLLIRLPL